MWQSSRQKAARVLVLLVLHLLLTVFTTSVCGTSTQVVRIGALFPLSDIKSNKRNDNGAQWLAGSLMAIDDLNQLYADRNVSFKFAVRDTKRTFSKTVIGTFDLADKVFENNGSHIIVGAGLNVLSEAIAYVLKDFNIAQIAYASNSTALSNYNQFPTFSRVYPSSSYESVAIANVIAKYFGYTRVILFYSTDDYGYDGVNQFSVAAADLKLIVTAYVRIKILDETFSHYFDDLAVYDARVFVLIVSSVDQASDLMFQGSSIGFFSARTVILSTGSLFTSNLWLDSSSDASIIPGMFKNFFAISNADNDWKVSPNGRAFIQRFRSLPDTESVALDGSRVCSNKTDDDGSFMLYKSSTFCTGNIFSALAADGSDISRFTAYSYDATFAAGTAVVTYSDIYHGGNIPTNIDGRLLTDVLEANVSFMGYTGRIDLGASQHSYNRFDWGGRMIGVRFQVSNFNSGNGSLADFALRRVGTWTKEDGFLLCGEDSTLQSALTGGCTTIRYGTSDNSKPAGQPETIFEVMSINMKIALYLLATTNFAVVAFIMFILVAYRKARLLKASQTSMMWIIVSANLFAAHRVVLASMPPSPSVCSGNVWMGHLAFMSIVAMFTKMSRIFILVKSGLHRRKVTAAQIVSVTGLIYVFWFFYLLLYTFISPHTVKCTRSYSMTGQLTVTEFCHESVTGFNVTLLAIEGAVLIISAALCYGTRDVPDAINEASVISLVLLLIVCVCAIGFAMTSSIGLTEYQKEFVVGICFFIASVGSMSLYFGRKTYLLLSGADLDRNFEITRPSHDGNQKISSTGSESHRGRTTSISSDTSSPQTAAECESQIATLKSHLIKIRARDAFAIFASSTPSFIHVPSFRRAHVSIPIQLNDNIDRDNQHAWDAADEKCDRGTGSTPDINLTRNFLRKDQVYPTNASKK